MNRRFIQFCTAGFCLLGLLAFRPARAATTICWPDAAPYNTGSVNGPTLLDSEIVAWRTPASGHYQNYYHEVGYARFNVEAVNPNLNIVTATMHYFVNDSSGHAHYKLTPLELDPLVTSDDLIRWDITADYRYFHYATCYDNEGPGWREVDLGPRGVENLRSSLDVDWFGVGFYNRESGIRVDGWAETNAPYLVVVTRPGPVTFHVDDDGPFDPGPGDPSVSDPDEDGTPAHPFDSIQEAIDTVGWEWVDSPDSVLVADGTYTGEGNRDITFGGRAAHVRSANGPENCVIDCLGSPAEPHRGFYFLGEGAATVVEGFTIRGGYANYGGAVYISHGSSPVIKGNVILENEASDGGGGIYFRGGIITGNTIHGNTANAGGGIYTHSWSFGSINNNTISGNSATTIGGGIYNRDDSVTLINNVVFGNQAVDGAGIFTWGSPHVITNCTVTGNTATGDGGGMYITHSSIVTNCIVRANEAAVGDDLYFVRDSHDVSFCNTGNALGDVYVDPDATVNWGAGMIHTDPEFASGAGGDFYLKQLATGHLVNSACIDSGSGPASGIQIPLSWDTTTGATTWMPISDLTTAINFNEDAGTVDMGYHYPALSTVTGLLDTTPAAGLLPFATRISTTLINNYTDQTRRMAARIDVTLAGGSFFPSWRAGWTNIAAGLNYTTSWMQTIPAYPTLTGENLFTLRAWDVTTAPYNQPPYPASGDSDSDTSVVTGLAP